MDKKLAEKLGELLAFANSSAETFEKGAKSLAKVFKESEVKSIITKDQIHAGTLLDLSKAHEVKTLVSDKAQKSEKKLGEMRKIYLEDAWDEPTEVLEWLGFSEGSALVHWSLVLEMAEEAQLKDVSEFAATGSEFHEDLLKKVSKAIRSAE